MFRKILYPTDFSDIAEKALATIKDLKATGSQQVIMLHVINRRIIDGLRRHGIIEDDIEKWQSQAEEVGRQALIQRSNELKRIGFAVRTIIKTGFPWQVILDTEKEEQPSIIVIGSHGRSNLGDMLLGSVSDRVIRKSRHPVLVIKRDAEEIAVDPLWAVSPTTT